MPLTNAPEELVFDVEKWREIHKAIDGFFEGKTFYVDMDTAIELHGVSETIVSDYDARNPEIETDERFWDCNCTENYIHAKVLRDNCPACGARERNFPDSMVDELKRGEQFFTRNDEQIAIMIGLTSMKTRRCDQCGRSITEAQYQQQAGLCVVCTDMVQ